MNQLCDFFMKKYIPQISPAQEFSCCDREGFLQGVAHFLAGYAYKIVDDSLRCYRKYTGEPTRAYLPFH